MNASVVDCGDKRKLETQHELTDEDDAMECSICSENWTYTGPHRLVSLRCGHLYGEKCIERWMFKSKGPKSHCPHCKQQIKSNDIRPVYPVKIAVQDTTELEFIKHELASTKAILIERQHQLEKSLLALSMSNRELERMKIKAHQKSVSSKAQFDVKERDATCLDVPSESPRSLQHFRTEYLPPADIYTRVMAIHHERQIVFVSTKKGGDYGVDLFSLERPGHIAFLPIHTGAIRDIKCRDELMLTCGHDKTIKLTSLKHQKVMSSIQLESPGWACSFSSDVTSPLIYCGLANDTTLVYDLRNTTAPLYRLQNRQMTGGAPIHSIIPMSIKGQLIVLCGNLNNVYAWKFDTVPSSPTVSLSLSPSTPAIPTDTIKSEPQCHIFDLEPLGVIDYKPYSLSMDDSDNTLLISLRRHNSTKHSIGLITDDMRIDVLHTFAVPIEQRYISRTLHYREQERWIVCYFDDDGGKLCLCDDSGETNHHRISEPTFDIGLCTLGNDVRMITALTNSKLHLYKYM